MVCLFSEVGNSREIPHLGEQLGTARAEHMALMASFHISKSQLAVWFISTSKGGLS